MPRAGEGLASSRRPAIPSPHPPSGGTLRTVVEGGLVTISVATSQAEVERLARGLRRAGDDDGARLDVHGRYVVLWLREPTRGQRR